MSQKVVRILVADNKIHLLHADMHVFLVNCLWNGSSWVKFKILCFCSEHSSNARNLSILHYIVRDNVTAPKIYC